MDNPTPDPLLKDTDQVFLKNNSHLEEGEKPQELESKGLTEILEELVAAGNKSEGNNSSVGDIIDAFGNRCYGPLLLIPALISLLPVIGAIPGLSMTMATWIILVAMQMLVHQGSVWVPERIRRFSFSQERLEWGVKKAIPWLRWIDKLLKPRLVFLARPPFSYGIAVLCLLLALTMYPLAFVIMGVGPPALAILFLALGLTTRDGVLVIIATALTIAAGWFTWYAVGDWVIPWIQELWEGYFVL